MMTSVSCVSDECISPWLVLAVGNPSRGDDALGPELVERLALAEAAATDVEFLIDFQLQVEHALDLQGRRGVLFVDAALPGVIAEDACTNGVTIKPLVADECVPPMSHALHAEAVLYVAQQFDDRVPPAWQLAIEGQSFALGEGLSESAEHNLSQGLILAQCWLDDRRASGTFLKHCGIDDLMHCRSSESASHE